MEVKQELTTVTVQFWTLNIPAQQNMQSYRYMHVWIDASMFLVMNCAHVIQLNTQTITHVPIGLNRDITSICDGSSNSQQGWGGRAGVTFSSPSFMVPKLSGVGENLPLFYVNFFLNVHILMLLCSHPESRFLATPLPQQSRFCQFPV